MIDCFGGGGRGRVQPAQFVCADMHLLVARTHAGWAGDLTQVHCRLRFLHKA